MARRTRRRFACLAFAALVNDGAAYQLGAASAASISARFVAPISAPGAPPPTRERAPPPSCCICINCKWVDRCQTYHWVETMHEQPHVTDEPDFDPNDPQIQVFIRKEGVEDADVNGAADDGSTDGMKAAVLSTEYDVFECDEFTEEKGKWLRLMPDADFIPT